MEYLTLGIIIDSFGVDGTLKIKSSTTKGNVRYKKGNVIFLVSPDQQERIELHVEKYRNSQGIDFVKVNEINSLEEALSKKHYLLQVIKDQNDLEKGEYFFSDLEGCLVIDNENKKEIGKVTTVEEFPAQITLRVKYMNNNKTFFVPFIEDFIAEVDIENKKIYVNVCKGMLWELKS